MNDTDNTGHVAVALEFQNPGYMQTLIRNRMFTILHGIEDARLTITDSLGTETFGAANSRLETSIQVLDPSFYLDVVTGGTLGGAEAYMQAKWVTSDLTSLVRILASNRVVMEGLDGGVAKLAIPALRLAHWARRNTQSRSRRNIHAHYDLGDEMFRNFLDPTMSYSASVYEHEESTLEAAALNKLELICQKLDLQPDDHLVEIGSGWGGLAIYAAKNYGCSVTTTTISRNQFEVAQQRVADAGLSDKITVLDKDYRELSGTFDKLVSVEMIEAVGLDYLDNFFQVCNGLLKPNGRMLLQSITIADRHFDKAAKSVDFIQKYIFPGGALPSLNAISDAVSRVTDLQQTDLHDIGQHYARTLHDWRSRFFANLPAIRQMGYPDEFIRMWDYYLSYCEGGFLERSISTVQLVFDKPECKLPLRNS